MALDQTTLMQEIRQISNNGAKPVHFTWTAQIEANGKKIIPIKVLNIDIERLYDTNYSDRILIDVTMGEGTYEHMIFPYKEDLVVTLIKTPIGEVATSINRTQDIENHRLRAHLVDSSSAVIEGNSPQVQDQRTADLASIKTVRLQLMDLALEQIRMQSVGGVMRKCTPGDAIRYFLTNVSKKIKVDNVNAIKGVDMVTPDNTEVRNHVILPHALSFPQVPGYIHQRCGGVYNSGFGFYLQQGYWYVFPQYDTKRWSSTAKTLTLINVPKNRLPGTERTYRKTSNQLIVLVTGETKHVDPSEKLQLNHGNGVRFTDAKKIMDGFGTALNNKYTALRSDNNNEFIFDPRKTGLNNVTRSLRGITSNNFFELSQLATRTGSYLSAVWENSDPGSIYPGMPAKYIYTVNDQVYEVYGTLLRAHHYIGLVQPGPANQKYVSNSALTIFVDKTITWNTSKDVAA